LAVMLVLALWASTPGVSNDGKRAAGEVAITRVRRRDVQRSHADGIGPHRLRWLCALVETA